MKYPLATESWDDAEIAAIQRVVKSRRFTMGGEVFEFEKKFARWVGSKYAVMVNSGSSANLAMIASLFYKSTNPLRAGDEIIVPAVSWSTTFFPLQQYGLRVKFIDVSVDTLNMDLDVLKTAITDRTRAIFAVNLLGNPNDFDEIHKLIGSRDILLLEDNCESLGATYNGKQAGTFGLMGSYSTFFSHHISTMEGGLVVTDDEELFHILLCLRAHGWTRNLPKSNLVCGVKSDNNFAEAYRFVLPGYNLRPVEMSGAIGSSQLDKLTDMVRVRRENAAFFKESFDGHPWILTQREIGASSWFGFSLILSGDAPKNRGYVVDKLQKSNVDVRPIVAGNFAKNPVLKWFDYEIYGSLRNSEIVEQRGFFVGNHHYPINQEIDYLRNLLS